MTLDRVVTALFIGLIVALFLAAEFSHDKPIHCPPGWKPNTGYLQHGCVPR